MGLGIVGRTSGGGPEDHRLNWWSRPEPHAASLLGPIGPRWVARPRQTKEIWDDFDLAKLN